MGVSRSIKNSFFVRPRMRLPTVVPHNRLVLVSPFFYMHETIFVFADVTFLFEAADGDVPYRPTAEAADAGQVEEDEDDDAIAARRARIRERLRARPTEEAEVLEVEQEDIAK